MKRLLLCLLLGGLLFSLTALPAAARDEGTGEQAYHDFLDLLPDAVRDRVPETAEETAEVFGIRYLFSLVIQGISEGGTAAFGGILAMIGLSLCAAAAHLCGGGVESETMRRALTFGTSVLCALALFGQLRNSLEGTASVLRDMQQLADGLAPVFAGLYAAGGSTATAATAASSFSMMNLIIENLAVGLLLPLAGICFAFTMLDCVSGGLRLDGFTGNLKGCYLTLLGLLCAVATAALSFQTTLAASADSVTVRTARFAVGNMIPLVGSSVGASLSTLISSLSLIKNGVGAGAVVAVIAMTLPTVAALYFTRLGLSLSASCARMLGAESVCKLFSDFRGIYDMILAVSAFVSVLFIFYLAVFVKCAFAL